MKPLLYLWLRTLVNAVRRSIRRPRTLIPALFAVLLVASQLIGFVVRGHLGAAGDAPAFTRTDLLMGGPGAFVVALRGIFLLALFSTLVGALGDGGLFFAQSDVDFLFPAPLSRRQVLLFKMAGRYLGLLFPACYLPLAIGNASLTEANVSPLGFLPGMLGAWLFLVAVANSAQVILLSRGSEENEQKERRRLLIRRILSGIVIALLATVAYFTLRAFGREGTYFLHRLLYRINTAGVSRAIMPDAWAADLFLVAFQGWHLADILRLLGLGTLATASFALLFAHERDFYEGAIEATTRRTRMVKAIRGGDAGALLSAMAQEGRLARGRSLRTFGGGAKAVLWKDCVSATRTPLRSWLQLLMVAVVPAILGGALGRRNSDINVLFWMFLFTLQMSPFFLLGLRDMLRRADISKALPISPMQLLLAELALSVAQLTLIGWFSLGVMAATGLGHGPLVGVAFLVLPTLAALLILVQTTFVVLYPNTNDPAQNMIANLLSVALSTLALLPAVTVGILLFFLAVPPLLLGLAVAVVNLIMAVVFLALATTLWKRYDPTDG